MRYTNLRLLTYLLTFQIRSGVTDREVGCRK